MYVPIYIETCLMSLCHCHFVSFFEEGYIKQELFEELFDRGIHLVHGLKSYIQGTAQYPMFIMSVCAARSSRTSWKCCRYMRRERLNWRCFKRNSRYNYSSFCRSSMLSPSVGFISSLKSVMPFSMRMLYHWMSFLISLLWTRSRSKAGSILAK